jgi:apolipoprotein N-acyltransferase
MSTENRNPNWRRWREAVFATCTVWLVLQNILLFTAFAWSRPDDALAAGAELARKAAVAGVPLLSILVAAVLGVALAAWLVQAPAERAPERNPEVRS